MANRDSKRSAARKRAKKAAPTKTVRKTRRGPFPIVGIGASAGGLEALERFLKHVPKRCGMAFVIIQHLDPNHKGLLVELLQRACALPVAQAEDRLPVEADHVYVIPPNKELSIVDRTLHLRPRRKGLNLPIDFFFRSLAEDQRERSIGVVLSGMGSDGTLGLRAIKEATGVAFVQAPDSAKFDSMPRSAIEAGLADVVAPVEELPGKIIAYHQHAPRTDQSDVLFDAKAPSALAKVFVLLRTETGNDFSLYKKSTIYRRVERRMGLQQMDKLVDYVRFLHENPAEVALLGKELLIGVTSFFRDPAAWEQLQNEYLPALVSASPNHGALRAWVPGCSTGEEAYSLAIVFKESLAKLKAPKKVTLQIFATDLDRAAIEHARSGVFSANIAADVSPERLRQYFSKEEHGYRVDKKIRDMVVFAPQNIITDPPFTKLEILSCRNLLIYLSSELQKKLIPLFHYCLNPAGILFLGSAETIGEFSNLFAAQDRTTRLYRRIEAHTSIAAAGFPAVGEPPAKRAVDRPPAKLDAAPPVLRVLSDGAIAPRSSTPVVLTNDKGDIVYVSGRTEKYLQPVVGEANVNVFAMAREGLRYELSGAFSAALTSERPATVRVAKVVTDAGARAVELTVTKLTEPKELQGTMMIVFADTDKTSPSSSRKKGNWIGDLTQFAKMEKEVRLANAELEFAREEMQTSQEELRSTNEELQSTNEELQSTNEELTTSKEEMQSMNEELRTLNQELQGKLDELAQSNSDLKNLLNSTEIATLFLDSGFHVRRFTSQAAKIIKLIPGDVGRPFTDIVTALDYPELADDAREVLETLVFKEKTVAASDNRWFSVRIMPYRTLANVIDGLVITFTDASVSKALEIVLRRDEGQLRTLADSLPELVWTSQADGAFDYLSRQWLGYTGVPEPELLGLGWLNQVSPDDRERVGAEWFAAVKTGTTFDSAFRLRSASGAYRWFKARAAPTRDAQGRVLKWYGASLDVDDIK